MKFMNMGLKQKVVISYAMMASLAVVVFGTLTFFEAQSNRATLTLTDEVIPKSAFADNMDATVKETVSILMQLALPGHEKQDFIRLSDRLIQTAKQFDEYMAAAERLPTLPGEQVLFDAHEAAWRALATKIMAMKTLTDNPSAENTLVFARHYSTEFRDLMTAYVKTSDDLRSFYKTVIDAQKRASDVSYQRSADVTYVSIALMLAFTALIAWFNVRAMTRSLGQASRLLTEEANALGATANTVSHSASSLSETIQEEAAAIQQTAASVEQVSAMVGRNAENSEQSREAARRSKDVASEGGRVVDQAVATMADISKSTDAILVEVDASNKDLSNIVKVIGEIENKTKVIHDIVFQTKLLSFNASVEAARAGEHGKGFAVVAEEVGNLAQMSGTAAKEISDILERSLDETRSIIDQTKVRIERLVVGGKEHVDRGLRLSQQTGSIFKELTTSVVTVENMVQEIATASQEQARGVKEIARAMGELEQVTHRNAATATSSSDAAKQLFVNSETLHRVIGELNVAIHGGKNKVPTKIVSAKPVLKAPANKSPAPAVKTPVNPRATQTKATDLKVLQKSQDKVVPLTARPAQPKAAKPVPPKSVPSKPSKVPPPVVAKTAAVPRVVGSDIAVPDANDPRFTDI